MMKICLIKSARSVSASGACGKPYIQGNGDPEQAISALLDLVPKVWEGCMLLI